MAKKKQASDDSLEGVEGALTKTEQFIEDNQKWIVRIITGMLALVVIFIGAKRFYLNPLEEEAHGQMFVAEQYFEVDSFNLALYGDGNYSGFLQIIDDYGSGLTDSTKIISFKVYQHYVFSLLFRVHQ